MSILILLRIGSISPRENVFEISEGYNNFVSVILILILILKHQREKGKNKEVYEAKFVSDIPERRSRSPPRYSWVEG